MADQIQIHTALLAIVLALLAGLSILIPACVMLIKAWLERQTIEIRADGDRRASVTQAKISEVKEQQDINSTALITMSQLGENMSKGMAALKCTGKGTDNDCGTSDINDGGKGTA